jgi:hypothetical protein
VKSVVLLVVFYKHPRRTLTPFSILAL